jgi:hypothetical protein
VSPEEIQHRRDQDLCIRCGQEGHYIPRCPYLPADRPGASHIAASAPKKSRNAADSKAKRNKVKKAQPVTESEEESTEPSDKDLSTESESENV